MSQVGDLTLALRTAQSGLLVGQRALDTVANNVANVNTPGYSRRIVNLEQRVLSGTGAGVQISEFTRRVDQGLLKSLRQETTSLNTRDVQEEFFARLQEMFGSPADNSSLSHTVNEFAKAMESLALAPDKSLEQSEVVRRGTDLTLQLAQMSGSIQELRLQADQAIGRATTEINELTAEIADLNDKIIRNGATNRGTTDLRDQRDLALDRLAELVDIQTFQRADGDVVVFTSAGRTLVDNLPNTVSHSSAANVTPTTTHAEGDFNGIFVGDQISGNDITTELRGGQLFGLVEMRDEVLTNLQSELDELAAELRDSINQVHNRGLPFPGNTSMTGTRTFVDTSTQSITFSGTADTRITLLDQNGDQVRTDTVRNLLGGATGTIDQVATAINTFLGADGTATAANGVLEITVSTANRNISFRDEAAVSTLGSTTADAAIEFDSDANGGVDETVNGFANFFGLNDFFTDGSSGNLHESNVQATTFTAVGASTLRFTNAGGLISTLAVSAGSSLSAIASSITNNVAGVTATVIPDGVGERLRIASDDGTGLVVTQSAGTLLTDIGLHSADAGIASSLTVRSDIQATPNLVSRGQVQFDADRGAAGEYFASIGDDTVAQQLTTALSDPNAFDGAGGIANISANFADYAGAIIAGNSDLASTNDRNLDFQRSLVDSLRNKSDSVRGVNLDEELADLILFEQAFSAAARVIGVIQNMFDALDSAIR